MRILAFDTSTAACSVALWCDGRVVAKCFEVMARGQSEALVPMIDETLQQAGFKAAEMDMLAVTTGPGAFTGVRIGLAAARGLALAIDRPVLGITTFEVLVHGVPAKLRGQRPVLCVIDTKRRDVFVQNFDGRLRPLGEARVASYDQILEMRVPETLLVGDGAGLIKAACGDQSIQDEDIYEARPDAVQVAGIAAYKGIPGDGVPPPGPVYLRPPEVRPSPDGGRLR